MSWQPHSRTRRAASVIEDPERQDTAGPVRLKLLASRTMCPPRSILNCQDRVLPFVSGHEPLPVVTAGLVFHGCEPSGERAGCGGRKQPGSLRTSSECATDRAMT